MIDAVGRRRLQWAGRNCVRIAPPVQQEVLVLHVRKTFRVESHAHKMEIGVEAVDLDGILDIVGRRAVAVVLGIHASAYNDGDGSTAYDVEYPIQIHGFDPNFHFVGMTFNPEGFANMKDKYFLLNGRSYPDTVTPGPLQTASADGVNHFSQPLPAIINIPAGKKALLRISDLDVTEYQTLASLGIPMQVVGYNAKLLRDQAGNNMYYNTNSITLGGGESLD